MFSREQRTQPFTQQLPLHPGIDRSGLLENCTSAAKPLGIIPLSGCQRGVLGPPVMDTCATISQGSKRSLDYHLTMLDEVRKPHTEGPQLLHDVKH